MKITKNHKGITLIALVITIIVLLILAGVGINMAISSEGLFAKANQAVTEYNEGVAKEEQAIADLLAEMENIDAKENIPNRPKLVDGMTPVKYTLPEGDTPGQLVKTNDGDSDWYNYENKYWANAQTKDGSLWVWIPRYAYRIDEENHKTEVVFLRGTSDNYYDEAGNIQTAKRCKTATDEVNTKEGFTVHPAFTNETKINYRNGGWDQELTGIWVAKFEAGYASANNNAEVVASEVNYGSTTVWSKTEETGTGKNEDLPARNWLDGIYGETPTAIKYPTFQPLTYSMNYINHSDAFELSQKLTGKNNIYGFIASTTDTHLMKDSEWGMVAYLSQSKYGLNETNIYINNITLNSGGDKTTKAEGNTLASAYGMTGCSTNDADGEEKVVTKENVATLAKGATSNDAVEEVYVWNQTNGGRASSTGNMYGIYDLSGGHWERTAGYVSNGQGTITAQGKSFAQVTGGTSSKYVKVYAYNATSDNTEIKNTEENTEVNAASEANYNEEANKRVYGDAIHETSTASKGSTSWYEDSSYFPGLIAPFSIRGGYLWDTRYAGLFSFSRNIGNSAFNIGFRAVVIAK